MILSHRRKFIYFAAGKTGTGSIETALHRYKESGALARGPHGKHIPPLWVRPEFPEEQWSHYFKFGFVRNPWDWVLSNYFWNKRDTDVPRSMQKFER